MLGYPGAGKTTAAKVIHDLTGATHLWADHERRKLFQIPTYSHIENLGLYDQLNETVAQLLSRGESVIFDTNFNFYKDRQKLRNIAAKHNATTLLIWVTTPKEVARERATKNAHVQTTRVLGNIPLAAFERISSNLEKPRDDEKHITVDGTKISESYIKKLLASTQ